MPAKRSGKAGQGSDEPETDQAAAGPPKKAPKAPSGRAARAPAKPPGRVGRPKTAMESGRYTPPIPRSVRRSRPAYGIAIVVLLVLGVLMVILNYLAILPGSTSVWYLVAGLAVIFVGAMMATNYR